jgi:hypothetical protein
MGERDNWESNCFSEIIASGDSICDLVDARVGIGRLVGDVAKNNIASGGRCLYLLHISVLGAWVDSKYRHAEDVLTNFLLQQTGASSAEALSPQGTAIPAPAMLFKKVLSDLQIKRKNVLLFVLGVGQRMNHAQQLVVAAAAGAPQLGASPWLLPSNLQAEEEHSNRPDLPVADIPDGFEAWFRSCMISRHQISSSHTQLTPTSKRVMPAVGKLLPLLKAVWDADEPPSIFTAQQILMASEELTLELGSWCERMRRAEPLSLSPRIGVLAVVAGDKTPTPVLLPLTVAQASDRPAVRTSAKTKRRIQPTLC